MSPQNAKDIPLFGQRMKIKINSSDVCERVSKGIKSTTSPSRFCEEDAKEHVVPFQFVETREPNSHQTEVTK
jgi:hypothetical protein